MLYLFSMEHNKATGIIQFNESELAVMPGMLPEVPDYQATHVKDIVFKLGNQCIQELIGRGSKSPMFSDKPKAAVLRDKLQSLHDIHDGLETIEADILEIPR